MSIIRLYDLPVREHFIQKNYTKGRSKPIRRIIIHHNAGQGNDPLKTWQTREASAHYQVWGDGRDVPVDQIVHVKDTAWHAHEGNDGSIGIEHENSKVGGQWPISDSGLHASAHLVGNLCAYSKLGSPAFGKNVTTHNAVESDGVGVDSGTACPGPYFIKILKNKKHWYWLEARQHYLKSTGHTPAPPKKTPKPPKKGKLSINAVAKQVIAGKWDNGVKRKAKLTKAGYNFVKVQNEVNRLLGY